MNIVIRIFLIISFSLAQIKPSEGLVDNRPGVWALKGAKVYLNSTDVLDNGIIIIRDGLIQDVGEKVKIPKDATILDLTGKTIYPGFIESWFQQNLLDNNENHNKHWNFKVNARRDISKLFKPNKKDIQSLRDLGFTAAHIVPDSGVFQGSTALIQLNDKADVINNSVGQKISYEVDGWGSDRYPNALLGVVALLRQTFIDADWYLQSIKKINKYPNHNKHLKINDDLNVIGRWMADKKPFIFNTKHELSALRSFELGKEFNLNIWIKGSGYEYRRIKQIKDYNPYIILPLDYPNNPDLKDPYQALSYTTSELKHWDLAPDNAIILSENNIDYSISSYGIEKKDFRKNIKRSINRGLSESDAIKSLTEIPAKRMGLDHQLGKIDKGFIANLTVVEGNYFDIKSKIISNWIGGKEFPVQPKYIIDISGKWSIEIGKENYILELNKNHLKFSGKIIKDTTEYQLNKLKVDGRFISWQIKWEEGQIESRFTGHILDNSINGLAHDMELSWTAIRSEDIENKEIDKRLEKRSDLSVFYPEGSYGHIENDLKSSDVLIKNATIWTSSDKGRLANHDILFIDGKINKIENKINAPKNALIIDGTGKHITPGLIDCHSHSAAFSINEGTQSITSEVRIQDVINSDDIAIYRELAGGLTMANILHGSANTIGGQNAVIKLRWGLSPNELLYENAKPGIKFALGENVKQANWGDDNVTRYPQTRMGVEQILRDAFTSAVEYKNDWNDYNKNKKKWKKKIPPRRNLELDALVEIIEGERQIHCHSYRQDEILMLTRVAEDFNFTVGTFQHVLEGYKVAERLKEHGANASTFSDWWAYKYEVIDAIPYNGNLMMDVGVNVSYNSDSNELARRMNTEAAKAFKYGKYGSKITEEEALHFVTINPAKQLNIDKWVGSLEEGKDADFVIWSDNPLSTKAVCEQTWIDGIKYFSLEDDKQLRKRDANLREGLINKILTQKNDDKKKDWKHQEKKSAIHHHCSDEYEN